MDTVKKGNILENKAIGIIDKLIDDQRLGVLRDCIKIFKKKKYPSKLKGRGEVEFDLTVEVWVPDAPKYSMIYIFECKNYEHRVPISEVKKFHVDITETHGVNAKGIIIAKSPLQKGAFEYAEAMDMMVIEGESKDNFKITLYKRTATKDNLLPFIKGKDSKAIRPFDEGTRYIEKIIDEQILNALIPSDSNVSFGIDRLSKADISLITESELEKVDEDILKKAHGLNKEVFIDYMRSEYDISVTYFNPNDNNCDGVCEIDKKEIGISKRIVETQREMFILAHEFGHYILHQKLSINQQLLDSFNDSQFNFVTNKHSLENPRQWIEWQANYFSATLLLPATSITAMLWKSMQRRGLYQKKFILNDDIHSQKTFQRMVEYLALHFNVSKTSIIYRLKELDLLVKNTRLKTIGQLISEYKEEYFI